jgi:hypothetical protein
MNFLHITHKMHNNKHYGIEISNTYILHKVTYAKNRTLTFKSKYELWISAHYINTTAKKHAFQNPNIRKKISGNAYHCYQNDKNNDKRKNNNKKRN